MPDNQQKGKRRKAYARKDINEVKSHDMRRGRYMMQKSREMREACDKALRDMGAPINAVEEMHTKAMVKKLRQDRKTRDGKDAILNKD